MLAGASCQHQLAIWLATGKSCNCSCRLGCHVSKPVAVNSGVCCGKLCRDCSDIARNISLAKLLGAVHGFGFAASMATAQDSTTCTARCWPKLKVPVLPAAVLVAVWLSCSRIPFESARFLILPLASSFKTTSPTFNLKLQSPASGKSPTVISDYAASRVLLRLRLLHGLSHLRTGVHAESLQQVVSTAGRGFNIAHTPNIVVEAHIGIHQRCPRSIGNNPRMLVIPSPNIPSDSRHLAAQIPTPESPSRQTTST